MHIALVLADFAPNAGGGYTFQADVYRAFVDYAAESRHEFSVLCDTAAIRDLADSSALPSNVRLASVRRSATARLTSLVHREMPITRRLLPGSGPIERAARAAGASAVWYVAGGAYEATDIPFVATVWDVQHRSHPWFPEVAAGGAWDGRERSLRRFLHRASIVITGTRTGQEELATYYGVPPARTRILPHPTPAFALEAATTPLPPRFELSPGYLLYPAQFWPHKNHTNLLLALRLLRDEHGWQSPLVLVGSDKGNGEHIRRLVEDQGLSEHVRFLGFVSQQELTALYKNALALTYVSWSGPENLPPLEAFALGCPVVASRIAGAEEQLGSAAVLVDPGDPADIAAAVSKLASDPIGRAKLVELGLARACRWTSREFVRGVVRIFDEIEPILRCWDA